MLVIHFRFLVHSRFRAAYSCTKPQKLAAWFESLEIEHSACNIQDKVLIPGNCGIVSGAPDEVHCGRGTDISDFQYGHARGSFRHLRSRPSGGFSGCRRIGRQLYQQ
jgi:hypothetical protein